MPISKQTNEDPNFNEYDQLRNLLNSMADAVIAVDESFNVALINGAALDVLDTNNALTGKPIDSVLDIIDKDDKVVSLKDLAINNAFQYTSRQLRLRFSDESTVYLYLSIAPVGLSYGNKGMGGHVILFRDISREISLEQERDEFISVVSHELRTPIAISEGNISNAQLIFKKSGIQNDFIDTALEHAHDQIIFLSKLVNDLSTLSRADKGTLKADITSINVVKLVSEICDLYANQAQAKGLELTVSTDPNLEIIKSSDLYLREILQNFITNSIKYTTVGSVSLSATARTNGVEFHVSDTGIGISKADQEKVFDKFFRAEDHLTRQQKGTGLGLYVTMKLAKLINATISVDSVLGKGTNFRIFVPNLEQ